MEVLIYLNEDFLSEDVVFAFEALVEFIVPEVAISKCKCGLRVGYGVNLVSVQCHEPIVAQCLLHYFEKCNLFNLKCYQDCC